ncbi:DNA recombination protein RmuC [Vreelandella olivaria]|uniref:DNA recombination protein RmuC n=1 Tax=Vreelandella olivaria TaxID=390919 RepID=UPI00201F5F19|nr:DNA recombination protein RmuC [Halomonas olivaria]
MQNIQWTTELITLVSVIGVLLTGMSYLLARALQSRITIRLTTQLEQIQEALAEANAQSQSAQASIKELETNLHEKELAGSRLSSQLINTQANEQRLTDELLSKTAGLNSLNGRLEEIRQQHHTAEKQLETFQADNRSLQERAGDLSQRLERTENELQQEREQSSLLKEKLAEEGKRAKALESSDKEAREQLIETKQNLSHQQELLNQLQERYQRLNSEYTKLNTTLESKEQHYKEQMQQLSETKQSLTKEFENLANKIFEEKGKTFTQTSQSSIDSMLKPFREQIEGFQKRINEVHDVSLQGNTNLNAEIRKVLDIGLQMSKEANNLTSALKGDSQQRGAWGEAQLRRTLEMSGLIEDTHFEVQNSFKDTDGKQKQTDYLIKLPDGKHIIIDSKVSLVAYDRVVSAETPEAYSLAMDEHIKAVRRHIVDLASKDYTSLVGMRSPSFVLMFMPIEPAYIEALKNNKDLFEFGYKKNIVLVSHTTLIPILRTVSNLWMMERSNAEAQEISEKAGEIYNQVCLVAERLQKLGGTLGTASNHYNDTVRALAGKQGLYGKVERFGTLSANVTKTMPVIESAHRDFETERLSMIVEAIEEAAGGEAPTLIAPTNQNEVAPNKQHS